jgi:hypothetical protein
VIEHLLELEALSQHVVLNSLSLLLQDHGLMSELLDLLLVLFGFLNA